MPALTARDSSRYGVRLIGYLLATTLLSGLVAGAGLGVAYALDPNILPTGSMPGTSAIAVAGAGGLLGGLLFLAGLLTVVFTLVTDAVHAGVNRPAEPAHGDTASTGQSDESDADEQDPESVPSAEPPETAESTAEATESVDDTPSDSGEDIFGESTQQAEDPLGGDSADEYDPTDPIDDPHSAQTDPFGTEAGPGEDEAWRKEIEQKLDEQEHEQ